METLTFRRATLHQAGVTMLCSSAQRAFWEELYPFSFESKEEAHEFATARGTDNSLIKMNTYPVFLMDNGEVRDSLDSDKNIPNVIHAETSPQERERLIACWDNLTSKARELTIQLLKSAPTKSEKETIEKIRTALKEAGVLEVCWKELEYKPLSEQELNEELESLKRRDNCMAPIRKEHGITALLPERTLEDAKHLHRRMWDHFVENQRKHSIDVMFPGEDSEIYPFSDAAPGYRYASLKCGGNQNLIIYVKM